MANAPEKHSDSAGPSFALAAIARYARQLRNYLGRRLQQPCDIDDVAQEVYLRLLRTNPDEIKKPLSFLLGVASNVVADYWEREGKERFPSAGDAVELFGQHASEALDDRLDECLSVQQQIEDALAQVSPIHALVLTMINRDGYSYDEVAQKLGLSRNTVHIYSRAARAQIRMAQWDGE